MSLPEFYKKNEDDSFAKILFKSSLIIILIVSSVVAFKFFFNWLAFESFDKAEAFQKLRSAKEQEKLMIAQEWLRHLQEAPQGWVPDSAESAYILAELESIPPRAEFESPMRAAALVAILGYAPDKNLIRPRILNVLKALEGQEKFLPLLLMGLLSLSQMGPFESPDEKDFYLKSSESHDSSIRKIFAFSSGNLIKFQNEFSEILKERLANLLSDEVEEVRWNSAFSLASVADPRAIPIVDKILDRALKAGQKNEEIMTQENLKLFEESLRAAVSLKEMKLRDKVYKISREHLHLKLRQAAKNFVEK
ncbi:MAG: hypothetical protein KA116_13260 [Proteobacteria bacterium]|nr:hypothetical protein [Pseudomonadota bacterium]